MAYNYLLELYALIENRLDEVQNQKSSDDDSSEEASFHSGRESILLELEEFITTKYKALLPRKVRQHLEKHGPHDMI